MNRCVYIAYFVNTFVISGERFVAVIFLYLYQLYFLIIMYFLCTLCSTEYVTYVSHQSVI